MAFSRPSTSTPRGMMLLNSKYRSIYDVFNVTQNGCTLRLYPEVNENGNPLPIRTGPNLEDVGNWVNGDHFMIFYKGGGEPTKERISLLLTIRGDEKCPDPNQRRGLILWEKIRSNLYGKLKEGTAPPHWSRWVASRMDAPFGEPGASRAKPVAFCRGMLVWYMTGKGPLRSVSRQKPKLNCIFMFRPAAQMALIKLTMETIPGSENYNGDDWDKVFKYNSKLVHPETGCLLSFGRPGVTETNLPVSFSPGAQSSSDDSRFKVEGRVEENDVVPLPKDLLLTFCREPWEEILQIWNSEQELLQALEVGIPDELLIDTFKDEPELLSERLQRKLAKIEGGAAAGLGTAVEAPAAITTPVSDVQTPTNIVSELNKTKEAEKTKNEEAPSPASAVSGIEEMLNALKEAAPDN